MLLINLSRLQYFLFVIILFVIKIVAVVLYFINKERVRDNFI